ncbi:MAG TPA: hypothetical protein VGR00_14535 [Thermoanaerobaculia bacterium]|nr:hypothetical protein [Thermoanaerobaculia bacterium]
MVRKNLWGGRFTAPPSEAMTALNDSFAFDKELLAEDVAGSIAWAKELVHAKALSGAEAKRIVAALRRIESLAPEGDHEDVHSFVEAELRKRVGSLAGKLHTGR